MKIDLSGIWNLKLDKEKKGIENNYFENFDYKQTINLPGTISQQKKSPETKEKATGYLTDPYKFEGWAWFSKELDEPLEAGKYRLCLERTRYSTLWINNKKIGECNTLNGKHFYDFEITQKSNIKITLLISNIDYIVPGGHMTSPDTQTNWLGITGEISITKLNTVRLENTKIITEVSKENIILKISTNLISEKNENLLIKIDNILEKTVLINPKNNLIDLKMPVDIKLWSDTNPELYELKLVLEENEYIIKIGFRTFKADGKYLKNNDKKVFLRGKHDGMIFPLTGFAPTDKESWLKVMKTAKDYGINHYRFHTCCPPEAAFSAADELGIYMSPELPFWGTIQAPGEEGFNEIQQNYLIKEGFEILDTFANHPSFVMMSMGNELWGSETRLDQIMKGYKEYDPTRLYTGGSNNFQFWPRTTEHEDYFVGVRFGKDELIRGSYAQCDAPLGYIQTEIPNSNHNYDQFFINSNNLDNQNGEEKEIEIQFGTGVKKVKAGGNTNHFIPNKPCISHEVGQYCSYPDFAQIEKYTGVLKPYNFEEFKKRLENAGLLNQADDFFKDSSRLAVQCYKNEIESALRSNELSGFQLLDIQDFTGQGTALVGVLDSFMESKGIVSGPQFRSFCNETVLLAEFEKFVYKNNDQLKAKIIFHNYSNKDYSGNFVTAYIIDTETDEILCEEQFDILNNIEGNLELGNFIYDFDDIKKYKKYALLLILGTEDEDSSIVNSYTLHVFPEQDYSIKNILNELKENETVETKDVILTKNRKVAEDSTKSTKKVIYFPTDFDKETMVEGFYCTDFWCYPMFRSISESMKKEVPVGTLGLTIDTKNPLVKDFALDSYTTPKWYNIISHSNCHKISDENTEVIIQMIDNFERNWKLGILYKTEDNIIHCTSRLWEIADEPEVCEFLKNIINAKY